jgi:hypothetical protein
MAMSFTSYEHFNLWWGAGVLMISFIDRLWTVRRAGWAGVGLAALILVEFFYGLYMQVIMLWALAAEVLKLDVGWHHVAEGSR